jgi:hypothetical protein
VQEVEGANVERGPGDEGHGNSGSARGSESIHVSDAGSQSNAESNSDGGSRSYNFGPLTVTISRI